MTRHAFTLEEADALLPHVRATLRRIQVGRDAALRRVDQLGALDALWGASVQEPGNHDHHEYLRYRRSLGRIHRAIERLVRVRLIDRGIRFPLGGLEHGLVDFPTTLDGRWIYLCWHVGEENIQFWHELQTGFAGRHPITPGILTRMAHPEDAALADDSALDF
jgi:hypothetical protein